MVPPSGHDVVGFGPPFLTVLPAEPELCGAAVVQQRHAVRSLAVPAVRNINRLRVSRVVEAHPEAQGVTCNTRLKYSTQNRRV